MTLVIMAAGMGSRFGGLKQIEPVGPNGEFIIDYSIFDAKRVGFDKVVFIIKEENYEIFKETIGKRIDKYINVEYVFQKNDNVPVDVPLERTKPLGTGHAILCCKDVVKENFAIINADDFYGFDAYEKVGEFLKNNKSENTFALIGYNLSETMTDNGSVKRGVCEIKDGFLTKLTESVIDKAENNLTGKSILTNETIDVNKDTVVSMNMFGFTPKIFEYLENGFEEFLKTNDIMTCEYLVPIEVNKYLEKGLIDVEVINTTAKWHGVTYKEDLDILKSEISNMIENNVYPIKLWN